MPGNYTYTPRATGETITAAKYNADHQLHVDNNTPLGISSLATTVTGMQGIKDPGEVGTESLATSLAGEIKRLRFVIKEIKGTTQWYQSADSSINGLGRSASVSLATNVVLTSVLSTISWKTENLDDSDFWSSGAPTIFTIPPGTDRVFLTAGGVFNGAGGSGDRLMQIIKNGAVFDGQPRMSLAASTGIQTVLTISSAFLFVVSGDTFSVEASETSTGTVTLNASPRTWFSITTLK